MPDDNIFKANPVEIMRLSHDLLKDYVDIRDKTDELMKEYKKLGETFLDDGYKSLGEALTAIEKGIRERNGHVGLVAHQLEIAARGILDALRAEAAAREDMQNTETK